jgi:MFS family permease
VALGLFSGIVVLVRSLGARIPDRLGAARATRIALALSCVGLVVVGTWREPAGLLVGTAIFGLGVALFTPALFALAVSGVPANERGAVMGTTSAFLDLAFGLGPATLGFVAAAVGRGGTFLAGAAVAAIGLVLVVATGLGRPPARARAELRSTDAMGRPRRLE